MRDTVRTLSVYYAEDCRHEATGQLSLIGIFNDAIASPTFPAVLAKFCIFIEIGIPLEHPLKELRIEAKTDDGKVLVDQTIPPEVLTHQLTTVPTGAFEGFEEKKIGLRTQFVMGPVVFEKPTMLRTTVFTELGEIRGRAIKITHPQPGIQLQISGSTQ